MDSEKMGRGQIQGKVRRGGKGRRGRRGGKAEEGGEGAEGLGGEEEKEEDADARNPTRNLQPATRNCEIGVWALVT